MTTPEEHLAQRVEDDAFFLASLLSLYAQCEDLNDAMLAEHLGGAVRDLPLLRLCRAPVLEPASDFTLRSSLRWFGEVRFSCNYKIRPPPRAACYSQLVIGTTTHKIRSAVIPNERSTMGD